MSAFFHFQHTLNRLFNNCVVILILEKFFLKCEGGIKLTPSPPPAKITLKMPSLIRVKQPGVIYVINQNKTLIELFRELLDAEFLQNSACT